MNVRSIVTRTSSALVILAFGALLVFAIGPHTGAYRTVSILSGSMDPTFSAGDVIITRPVPTSTLQPGDVITYHAPIAGRPVVTHRVIEVKRGSGHLVVRTKGDANQAADPWEARLEDDTAWRQVAVLPYAGTVLAALRSEHVRNALLYGAPSLLIALLLVSIWTPSPNRGAARSIECVDFDGIFDVVQADLMGMFDATCVDCGSSTCADAPCPFCDELVPDSYRHVAVA